MKIGNKIICKDDSCSKNLFCGDEYLVLSVNGCGNIQLENESGEILPHFYKPDRFGLIGSTDAEAKTRFDSSKQYKTRDGRFFHFIGISENKTNPIVGEFLDDYGVWQTASWNYNGCFYGDSPQAYGESSNDLVEVPDKIELSIGGVTVVVYDDLSILFNGDSATEPLTEREIDLFIETLKAFKK